MPKLTDSQVTLEELLKLKRHEEPQPAFWEQFDRDLERRRLRALVVSDAERTGSFFSGWRRGMAWASGSLAAAAAVGFAVLQRAPQIAGSMAEKPTQTELVAVNAEPDAPVVADVQGVSDSPYLSLSDVRASDEVESRFVLDEINARFEQAHFRSVLSNPAFIGARTGGAQFIADTWTTTGKSRATFLVDRPSGQF